MAKHICIDCSLHRRREPEDVEGEYCEHFMPDYWVEQGYQRNWGDAAVMMWPQLEILRRSDEDGTKFLILAPATGIRRPVIIYSEDKRAWGAF